MRVMNFKSWTGHMNESIQNDEMDRILDKISNGETLSDIEKRFLNTFGQFSDDYYKEFSFLSKNDVFDTIQKVLSDGRKVICDLRDRDGKIGIEIQSVHNNFADESCYVILKNGQKIELTDNYLYNMIYNIKKDEYSLESQDEYYEKIPLKDENN